VNELLDVVTRVYEYQRAYPTLVGTASGLETVRLVLQGKLPTPPIIATLGISLVDAAARRPIFEGSPAEWQYNTSEPCMEAGSSRCSTPRPAARSKPGSPEFAGLPRSICMFGSWR
jgi:hypothetical protein